jgi:hypothetical protein
VDLENDVPCDAISLNTDGTPEEGMNGSATVDDGEPVPPNGAPCTGNSSWCDGAQGDADAVLHNTLWYSFEAPASGVVEITTCNGPTNYDTQVAAYSADDCSDYSTFTLLGANEDNPTPDECDASNNFASTLTLCGLNEGDTYYVQLDGWDGEVGTAAISVSELDASVCTARLQVVHNSADMAAQTVDIRVNGDFPAADFDDLEFRNATATIDAPAGVPLDITINAGDSQDDSNPLLLLEDVTLTIGGSFQVIAQGIASDMGYDPGSDEAPLDAVIINGFAETNPNMDNTLIAAVHGATDAPDVDIDLQSSGDPLFEGLSYGDVDGYLDVAADNYVLDVTPAGGADVLASFSAPLADLNLGGAAISVFASGFLDPSVNSDGPAFGLWASLPEGGPLVELPVVTSVDEIEALNSLNVYPNPGTDQFTIQLNLAQSKRVTIDMVNLVGQTVLAQDLGQRSVGNNLQQLNIRNLSEGFYLMNITIGDKQTTTKVQVTR